MKAGMIRVRGTACTGWAQCYTEHPKITTYLLEDYLRTTYMNEKQIRILATVATIASICMYTSYIFQIQANLAGHKGNPIQPLCAAINCTLWVVYGLFKKQRDWPIAIANSPGVVLGLITCITSL